MKLSVVMIVRNEEDLLPKALDSLKGVWDELVIVDTGSTDSTKEIARAYGAIIDDWPWQDDFAAARNHAESLCGGDYIYWQDADEVLVEGRDAIREIVEAGTEASVRPVMVFYRDKFGNPGQSYARQDLLHQRGSHIWKGKVHEWTEGPMGRVEKRIVVEQLERPGGDRPHGDIYESLRRNFTSETGDERHLYYLAREHAYAGHYAEAVALIDLMLTSKIEWPIQRSCACILKGDILHGLKRDTEARVAYLRAIEEWGAWAEPYFSLGKLHYDLKQWSEGAAWLSASTRFERDPSGYFTTDRIYDWERYDLLAVCLYNLGNDAEAEHYGALALRRRPNDQRLKDNMQFYRDRTQAAVLEV